MPWRWADRPAFRSNDKLAIIVTGMRATEWTFRTEPLRRLPNNGPSVSQVDDHKNGSAHVDFESSKQSFSHGEYPTIPEALTDSWALMSNLRGQGWDWGQGWQFPAETRPTSSRSAFLASTLLSAVTHFLIFDVTYNAVRSFSPSTFGSSTGGTIFDPSLPAFPRYTRSTLISLLSGITIYSMVQMTFDIATITGVLILQQDPLQWPPLFDSPWRATSLVSLWARRWHQTLRSTFMNIGVKPLSFFIGRDVGVIGAFILSAIIHDWGLWSAGRGTEFWSVGGFFLVMGVGCVMERLLTKLTGLKVGGCVGWLWTTCWMVGWGSMLVDGYARKGLIGSKFMPREYMPSQILMSCIYGSYV